MIKQFLTILGVFTFILVTPVAASAATLSLDPSSGVLNKGCEITLDVKLDTQGVQTDGTDVIVLYTPAQLSITTSQITNGTIYPDYPGNSVDSASGKVSISGISSVASPYTGSGTFAKLKFKVADTLQANAKIDIRFDFDPNNKTKTTDTNVVERGTIADVLSSVTNGSYTVGTGTCTGTAASPSPSAAGVIGGQGQNLPGSGTGVGSTPLPQYQVYRPDLNDLTGNGKGAGLLDNTLALAAVGVILVVLGVAGLAML